MTPFLTLLHLARTERSSRTAVAVTVSSESVAAVAIAMMRTRTRTRARTAVAFWLILVENFPRVYTGARAKPPEIESFNYAKSSAIDEFLARELSAYCGSVSLRGGPLEDLYFHLGKTKTTVLIENAKLLSPDCARFNYVRNDVFARRMDLGLTFPKLVVLCDVTLGGNLLARYDGVSFEIYNVTGAGICFTRWYPDGYRIINCDIRYRRGAEPARMSTRHGLPLDEALFRSASVRKLWKGITKVARRGVIGGINSVIRRMDTGKALENPEVYQRYKDYVIESKESANEFVDGIMSSVKKAIKERFGDSFKIPDIEESFRKRLVLVTWKGSFRADGGTVRGLSTVSRMGDTAFAKDNASRIHFFGNLSFTKLDLHYDRYRAEFMNFGPSGTLNTRLRPIRLHIHPYVNFDTGRIYLEDFEIEDVGELVVEVTGLGTVLDWILSKITTWVVGLVRDRILDDLERKYDGYIKSILSGYTIDDITSGKAFDGPRRPRDSSVPENVE